MKHRMALQSPAQSWFNPLCSATATCSGYLEEGYKKTNMELSFFLCGCPSSWTEGCLQVFKFKSHCLRVVISIGAKAEGGIPCGKMLQVDRNRSLSAKTNLQVAHRPCGDCGCSREPLRDVCLPCCALKASCDDFTPLLLLETGSFLYWKNALFLLCLFCGNLLSVCLTPS